ncbi:MAG: hypothetical protein PHH49_06485 [Candidatus Omnitrophica bacterium]|nr:hypothetical protein [Candidatus Omnitrophota bacterium]
MKKGPYPEGYSKFSKDNNISQEEAIKLAEPYLDLSFSLRKKSRDSRYNSAGDDMAQIWTFLRGDYYYITKDNYYYKTEDAYFQYAVKVHKDTGEVIPPGDK